MSRGQNRPRAPGWFLATVIAACIALMLWTPALAITLPRHYTAQHWALTWIGFDVALVGCLAWTAWLAYRRRQAVVLWALVTAALLLCDAWFDVMTAARADLAISIASAALAELPLAGLLIYAARHVLVHTTRRARVLAGHPDEPVRLSRVPLFGSPPD